VSAADSVAHTGFGAADLGALVMVRYRLDAGATDVVGELEAITAFALVVRRRDDSLVEVARDAVLAAKLVGVSPLAARTLEGVAARGWPAPDTGWIGRWWLRAAGGFTARANSVRPLGPPDRPLDDALDEVTAWYRDRDLPPRIQVVVGSSLDAELDARGWPSDPEVCVQTVPIVQALARLAAVPAPVPAPRSALTPRPSPRWLRAFRGGNAGADVLAVLTGAERPVFAELFAQTDTALAIGRAAVELPWVGITAVEVAPDHRRNGLATAVMLSLLRWAQEAGARQVYLEVLATNEPALALYRTLGFRDHHRYRCRSAPGHTGSGPC
jgi:GNAT superfamily N-acetyltransferase